MKALAVPIKRLEQTKTRLEGLLNPLERAALTLAMMEDVLDAATRIPDWEVWVISSDEVVLEAASRAGAEAIEEDEPDLAGAMRQLEEQANAMGVERLAILLGDTPCVTAETLIEALGTPGEVVLVPSRDRAGTNLLVRTPPSVIPTRFGSHSFRKHLEASLAAGVTASVVESADIGFDVDAPDDILTLLDSGVAGRTRDLCLELDLTRRLKNLN